ncbi:polysulfide reductase NrfD [Myxococcus sp. MxC21-1]|uniref:NrfD/PsrC family molybdoenzyme membrane anchor subunit n=1 Tax=Myxococcus sp. MxC21-1 TaxID=3041439 RepID=UPI00292D2F76|nr:NrfD/PsrC family molybdoenzyme membrane anchor subunit [Myxococcus sp. MxC21-1]WNZ65785.1 polysulfide reductase NrfD [Myxococcus sp. MxC21-1]
MTSPHEPGDSLLDRLQRRGDGRNVDPALGVLAGEGAQQRVETLERTPGLHPSLPETPESPSYYGLPVIKEPVWIAAVPMYLYVGGVAGATSVLGLAVELTGGRRLQRLARRCVWVGTVGDMVSAGLLIYDLGRPARFLNMLRVFRPTSPMSIGSWVLAGSGASTRWRSCWAAGAACRARWDGWPGLAPRRWACRCRDTRRCC